MPLLCLLIIWELALRAMPNEYKLKHSYLNASDAQAKILFLGSSHAYFGIDPALIPEPSFNSANVAQTLNYDYRIYKKYASNLKKLEFILIPISYFTLFSRLEDGAESWRQKNYTFYYGLKTEGDWESSLESLSRPNRVNAMRLFDYYADKQHKVNCTDLGYGVAYKTAKHQDLDKTGALAAKRHTKPGLPFYDYNREILIKFIELANARGVTVIFYTPPAAIAYSQNLEEKQLSLTVDTMVGLDNEYEKVFYVNLLNEASFTAQDFYDGDHLSGSGAIKLTGRLYGLIKEIRAARQGEN